MNITLELNMKLLPFHRNELEESLEYILCQNNINVTIDGGGTFTDENGEVKRCDIEIILNDKTAYDKFLNIIQGFGFAKGSKLISEKETIEVGNLEGFAIYLNGSDLSCDVYKNCDVNYVIEKLETIMDGIGLMYSYYEGDKETALYFYGTSFKKMEEITKDFIAKYPLCEKCRIVQIS